MNKRQKKNVSVDCLAITRRITRSMSLKNGKDNSVPIPIDVLIMIFGKLSLKCIARCRCVSKLWASILSRSDFTELFLSRSCSRTPKLLLTFRNDSELVIFSSIQPQNPDENFSHVIPNYQIKFSFDGNCDDGDLVHGLICLDNLRILKICNPSTGQTIILPKEKTHILSTWWSLFGYDPIGKQFKVLSMRKCERHYGTLVCDEYQVLPLGSEQMSWKMIECCIPHYPPDEKICINGVLYYTSIHRSTLTCLIVCFDVRFETFSFINIIGIINQTSALQLINYNGKLGLLIREENLQDIGFDGRSIRFKLWVLEDVKKQEWSDHTFLFPITPENIVGRIIFSFVGVTLTNEIVLSSCYKNYPFYLFYLNIEKKTIVKVTIDGIEELMNEHNGIEHIFLDHVEDVKLYGT